MKTQDDRLHKGNVIVIAFVQSILRFHSSVALCLSFVLAARTTLDRSVTRL